MTDKKTKELQKDLEALKEKYKITGAAFTGMCDNQFLGIPIGKMAWGEMFEMICNVGRLWQYMRQMAKDNLNNFEK